MKKNTFITLISLIIIASLPVNVAFSHEETLETLKNKEEKILKLLSNPQVKNEKKETKVTLKKTDDDSKSKLIEVSYQDNYLKRILKRKNLRKQIAMTTSRAIMLKYFIILGLHRLFKQEDKASRE